MNQVTFEQFGAWVGFLGQASGPAVREIEREELCYIMEHQREELVEELGKVIPQVLIALKSRCVYEVNSDALPFIPQNWSLTGEGTEHRKGGKVKLERRGDDLYANSKKVELFLSDGQEGSKCVKGTALRKELADKQVLNATVLDYLLAHPELIPESWKGKFVFFWGTIYRVSGGGLYVRCLCWDGDRWDWDYYWLEVVFRSDSPSAVSTSQ